MCCLFDWLFLWLVNLYFFFSSKYFFSFLFTFAFHFLIHPFVPSCFNFELISNISLTSLHYRIKLISARFFFFSCFFFFFFWAFILIWTVCQNNSTLQLPPSKLTILANDSQCFSTVSVLLPFEHQPHKMVKHNQRRYFNFCFWFM